MLLNSGNLKILLGHNTVGSRKKDDFAATDALIKNIVQEEMCGKSVISKIATKKRKRKRPSNPETPFPERGIDFARMRLLFSNNLFEYTECFGVPRPTVDIIEKQYHRIRQNVKTLIIRFLQTVERLVGSRVHLTPSEVIIVLDEIGISNTDSQKLYNKLFQFFETADNAGQSGKAIELKVILQALNAWANSRMLVELLGDRYGCKRTWEERSQNLGTMAENGMSARNTWHGDDAASRTAMEDLHSLGHSVSLYSNQPSLKSKGHASRKLMTKSKSTILLTAKPGSYATDIYSLRHELELARNGVDKLNRLVDSNIAWVQSNCDLGQYASHFSVRAKQKCQKMATERIFAVFEFDCRRSLMWALDRWKSALLYETFETRVSRYCKAKSIHMLTVSLVNLYLKCLVRSFNSWLNVVRLHIRIEKDVAAAIIQSVVRRYLSKVRFTKLRLGKTAVVIQNLFRKVKAVKVVKQKSQEKMNIFAAMAIQKLMKRLVEIRKAKAELKRRREAKAAIKIQKVFRGMKGREKFQQVQDSLRKIDTAPKSPIGNLDLDALAVSLTSPEKTTKIKKPVKKMVAVRQLKKDNSSSVRNVPKGLTTAPVSPHKVNGQQSTKLKNVRGEQSNSTKKLKKTPTQVKTAEIEIQTDFEWIESLKNDLVVANVADMTTSAAEDSALQSTVNEIMDQSPNKIEIYRDQEDNISLGSSVASQASDEAAILIQKVARGKLVRKDSKKSNGSTKTSSYAKIDNSTEAVTKIQKIARGKLVRSMSKQAQNQSSTLPVNTPPPSSPVNIQPSNLPVPSLPVENVNTKGTGMSKSGRRSGTPSKSSRTVKSARSVRSSGSVREGLETELGGEIIEDPHHAVEFGSLKLHDKEDEIQHLSARTSDHLNCSTLSLTQDPTIKNSYLDDCEDEEMRIEKTIPETRQYAVQPSAVDPEELLAHPTAGLIDSSCQTEQSTKESTERPQSKGFLSNFTSGIKTPAFVKNSLEFFNSKLSPSDRPHTTNSTTALQQPFRASVGELNSKPQTAPMKIADNAALPPFSKSNSQLIQNNTDIYNEVGPISIPEVAKSSIDQPAQLPITSSVAIHSSIDGAATVIQKLVRLNLARKRVSKKRQQIMESQKKAAALILWAVITLQRIARGRQGRKKFHKKDATKTAVIAQKKLVSAIKIQAQIRRFLSKKRVQLLRSKEEAKKKQKEWLESLAKKATPREIFKEQKVHEEVRDQISINSGSSVQDDLKSKSLDDSKIQEIDIKLKMLEDIEKRIRESEEKVRQEALRAEERLQEQIRLLEEKSRQAEADRLAREELMKLAVGNVSHRSPFSTLGTIQLHGPNSARAAQKSAFSTISSAPPTGRSAREGPIPSTAPRLLYNNQEWVQLWDQEQRAYYWWCDKTQIAQWEQPGMMPVSDEPMEDRDDAASDSGYESTSGMTDYSTDHEDSHYGSEVGELDGWTEYWDEQAQAKYWYNNKTGEASWTLPDGLPSANSTVSGSTASRPGYGSGWTSYIDDETGQMYWHNINTGEVQWDC